MRPCGTTLSEFVPESTFSITDLHKMGETRGQETRGKPGDRRDVPQFQTEDGRMVEQNRSGSYTQIVYGPNGGKLALMNGGTLQKAFVGLTGGATAVYTASGLDHY